MNHCLIDLTYANISCTRVGYLYKDLFQSRVGELVVCEFKHTSVLLFELVDSLALSPGDIAIDCTAGGGGHTKGLLDQVGKEGKIYAIDQDLVSINNLKSRFSEEIKLSQLSIHHHKFSSIDLLPQEPNSVSGIVADLGISSMQIDKSERGFSFMHDGPLDMRMSPESDDISARALIATYDQKDLEHIIKTYGEEPKAKFIAEAIVKYREKNEITQTLQLAEIVKNAVRYPTKSKKHPATRTFQALRIYINNEIEEVEMLLEKSFTLLKSGGRMGIISFHSLEDRIVKKFFREKSGKTNQQKIPKDIPLTHAQLQSMINATGQIVRPFPLRPKQQEVAQNPRSRSAKLRVLEKI